MPGLEFQKNFPSTGTVPPAGNSARQLRFRAFLAYAGLVTLVFLLPLIDFVKFANSAQYYTHLVLIPVISLYLIWEKRATLREGWKTSLMPGTLLVAAGIAAMAYLYSGTHPMHLSDHNAFIMFSFLCLVLAGAFLCFGSHTLRKITFPLAFLVFTIPVPAALLLWIQIQLQLASAEAADAMISLINIPFLRDGVDFKLAGIPIRVAEECSGFNSSYVLFMVSLLGGYLFLKSPWRRTALTLAVIPLAILRNGFRITTIAWLCTYQGPHMIHSPIHHRGGPIFFALSLIPFLALIWWLRRSEKKQILKAK